MSWTENASRYRVDVAEFVAKVGKPQSMVCPTEGCGFKATPHCDTTGCLWYSCEVCEHTTWISPKYDKGPLGRTVLRWSIRRTYRLPKLGTG